MTVLPPRGTWRHRRGTVTQAQLLQWGTRRLALSGYGAHEARQLLQWALGEDSLLRAPNAVGMRAAERYRSAIAQRTRGYPLQHITGSMQFRHLDLLAGPGVFSVRPETEMIIDLASPYLQPGADVADLCAGSGAIGLAAATEFPGLTVTAVEFSASSAAYARRNYDRHRDNMAPGSTWQLLVEDALAENTFAAASLDVILSNPPYVPGQPPLQGDVLFDPEAALYGGGEDGLVFPRGLVGRCATLLRPGGVLIMEHDPSQGEALQLRCAECGFAASTTEPDLTGRPRFLVATR